MPLKGDYTWHEKSDHLKIQVPLKGVSPKTVDIFVTAESLKVNYSPFIIDILLSGRVDPTKQKAVVRDGTLIITLMKEDQSPAIWGSLESDINGNKSAVIEKKQDILKEYEALGKDLQEKRKDKKMDDERHALKLQMGLDNLERDKIDNLKQEEKQAAEKEVYETFARLESNNQKEIDKKIGEAKSKSDKKVVKFNDSQSSSTAYAESSSKDSGDIFGADDYEKTVDDYLMEDDVEEPVNSSVGTISNVPNEVEDDEMKYVPPPRAMGAGSKVDIKYTPRVFPTPMRESKQAEEDDWIAKNRRHLKKHGLLGQNLPKGNGEGIESDPNWLKAKGDDFFRSGDYQSALNAYCSAIEADDKMISCYSNRSNCYLKLNLFNDSVLDSDSVIQMIIAESEPPAEGVEIAADSTSVMVSTIPDEYRPIYMKTLIRRGMALSFLGQYDKSLKSYLRALQELTDYNKSKSLDLSTPFAGISVQSVKQDIGNIETLVKCDKLKRDADTTFGEQNLDKALALYNEALEILPFHVGCLSNRAACYLSLGQVENCINDCTTAIELLQFDPNNRSADSGKVSFLASGSSASMIQSILPLPGSEKRKAWVTKTLVRRGMASIQLNNMKAAVEDYREACQINPNDTALKNDLKKLEESCGGL